MRTQRLLGWGVVLVLGALILRARLDHAEEVADLRWLKPAAEEAEQRARILEARIAMCEAQR